MILKAITKNKNKNTQDNAQFQAAKLLIQIIETDNKGK